MIQNFTDIIGFIKNYNTMVDISFCNCLRKITFKKFEIDWKGEEINFLVFKFNNRIRNNRTDLMVNIIIESENNRLK